MLMLLLSNWRLWAIAGLLAANAVSYSVGHHRGYLAGKAEVQATFDSYRADALEQALAAQAESTLKTQAMQAANEKVSADYVSLQTATATAVGALNRDRLRLQAAIAARSGATPDNPGPGLQPDAGPEVRILGACITEYESVASDAQSLSDKVTALQAYVNKVVSGAKP
jgi:hypothetical protein